MSTEERKQEIFKGLMAEFMLNKSNDLECDRVEIMNRISLNHLTADSYYDLLVNDIRQDYARYIFRQIRELMDMFL